ncbi:MAG TPA: sigma-70 family RNA polymerase sigma factor [Chitinophagaceae bacterium]|mgnify:CR=1 FL=1|jgi:RNA polymerase sigma factor (sigma-70 family)|nr:sigma-70 family RNA polymerase sigma factor [Chitinophagaceae bacterium]
MPETELNDNLLQSTKTYSEQELLLSLRNGDQSALSYLYDYYGGALNNVILNMIKDEGLCEDILQETFLKIWNNIKLYDENKGRLFTWMRTIACNLAMDKLRSKDYKKRKLISGDETMASLKDDEQTNVDSFIAKSDMQNRMSKLESQQRLIINLSYFEGYTQEQIAAALSMPLGTVKTKIRTAIISLRKTFNIN